MLGSEQSPSQPQNRSTPDQLFSAVLIGIGGASLKWFAEGGHLIIRTHLFLILLVLVGCSLLTAAQTNEHPTELYTTIKSLDAKLFEAYNTCDLKVLGSMVADDLEFYHDQT